MNRIELPSPDGSRTATLNYVSEVRFGPPYYHLEVAGHSFGDRVFGDTIVWSDDSAMLVAQEWLSTTESRGPVTRLVVFDATSEKEWTSGPADGGFMTPLSLDGLRLTFEESYFGHGMILRRECRLMPPSEWK